MKSLPGFFLIIVCAIFGAGNASAAPGATLTMVHFDYYYQIATQDVSVRNNTAKAVGPVRVECSFFSQGQIIETRGAYISDIQSNGERYVSVTVISDVRPDNVKCRIVESTVRLSNALDDFRDNRFER
jgi:hypothetical protein